MDRRQPADKQTDKSKIIETEITSASVKNANASGDGAVQKSDELLEREEPDEKSNEEVY
ncbi:MAG TPA: hypothetical protein VEX63_13860 [Flavisolibacter sp.]|jgi:hypothetical protein|nr:hypothetical protein [Flavisolibacter sp.]